jgi:hypothetical protein
LTERLITKDFFAPVLAAAGKGHPYGLYLAHCGREKLVETAMIRARDAGGLGRIEDIGDRDFEPGHAWNKLQDGSDLDDGERFLATQLILDRIDDIVGNEFVKHMSYLEDAPMDREGLRRAFPALARKIEKFLETPRMYLRDRELPRGTDYTEREAPRSSSRWGTQYLVRIDGWNALTLMEKPMRETWRICREEPACENGMEI